MHVHDGVPMTKLTSKYQFDVSKLKYKLIYNIGAGSLKKSPMNWDKYTHILRLIVSHLIVLSGRLFCVYFYTI